MTNNCGPAAVIKIVGGQEYELYYSALSKLQTWQICWTLCVYLPSLCTSCPLATCII